MNEFYKEKDRIYRLRVPFAAIYTSVFLIESEEGDVLLDCATTADDVDNRIIPALECLGKRIDGIKYIVISHNHKDHAGGLTRILERAPNMEVIREVKAISSSVSTYPLAGHTEDLIGIFDKRSRTLISADGLQGAGVDRYRCYTQNPTSYIATLERIKNDEMIENILLSHAYEPWNKDSIIGRENVIQCLIDCSKYVKNKE